MYKISIVTPCFNAATFIGETVASVLNQRAVLQNRCELEYIICDGGSSDETLTKIESFKNHPNFSAIRIISQPDEGMYDALANGLSLCSGDIVSYINADDFYSEHAFDIVLEIFEHKKTKWLTGYNVIYNEESQIVRVNLPFKYRKRFFECGCYGPRLPYVQQESTFWHISLNKLLDLKYLSTFKYAGDFYIWQQFSKEQELQIIETYLGGFRFRKGQISESKEKYHQEMASTTRKLNIIDFILLVWDKILWYAPSGIKKKLNQKNLIRYNHKLQSWI